MIVRKTTLPLILTSCLISASLAFGSTFTEIGDAGTLPAAAQVTSGTGPLTAISGMLTLAADFSDMYEIFLTGGGTFSATTTGGAAFDTELFLFDSTGHGVYAQDDVTGFFNQSTLPSGNALTPTSPGLYFLAITQCCFEPSNASGLIFNASGNNNVVVGPTASGGTLPITGYTGTSDQTPGGGPYTITLTGAEFASSVPAPEPGAFGYGLLAISTLVCYQVKRRQNL
jgi:hypothetical protein